MYPHFQHVYATTSSSGLEALFQGVPVTCFGVLFYAGWGLTDDRGSVPDRPGRPRTLTQLVATAYLRYPVYVDPVHGARCSTATGVERIAHKCRRVHDDPRPFFMPGMRAWKRNSVAPSFGGRDQIIFTRTIVGAQRRAPLGHLYGQARAPAGPAHRQPGRTDAGDAGNPHVRPLNRRLTAEVPRLAGGRVLKMFKAHIPVDQVAAEPTALSRAQAAGLQVRAVHGSGRHAGRQPLTLDELTGPSARRALARRPHILPRPLARMADLQVRLNALPGDDLPDQTPQLRAAVDRADLPATLR